MSNFILIPGAWMGAWAWKPVTDGLRALGHDVHPVTLTGLADKDADVSHIEPGTHVDDVLSAMEESDLRDVVVVGHLYAGIVAGQVTDRVPDRVSRTVFLEAFLPHDGKAMLDALSESGREDELRQIAENGGRWPAPSAAEVAHERDLSAEQARWLAERFVGHPGRTVSEPVVLSRPLAEQQATYIVCTMGGHSASEDVAAMREEPNWTFRALEAGHWPMVSSPEALVALLAEAASSD